ncbi:MAG: Gfo/Idh/MocA family oxidoreductase [Thermoclostridium sp.]|nr:Gfo/Idh/MocA family oxidoreductase [Thermoclostridium sp.]
MTTKKIGIIGCGDISGIYLSNLTKVFRNTEVVACASRTYENAAAKAQEFGIMACSTDELLQNPGIDIVLNLTTANVHYSVSDAILSAGKHLYTEKPLAVTREEGKALLRKAREKKLMIGSAPDTVLGSGIQTCRKLIDDGWIGKPIAATAFMMSHGPESWHPNPEFFYQIGGGPMFDMGPYYLTALVNLIGPVKKVSAFTAMAFPQRMITTEVKYGKIIDVEVPTHVAGLLEFESGAVVTLVTSFDVWVTQVPRIEIYGTEGTLSVPDPNTFGGPVFLRRENHSAFNDIPLSHPYHENSRGVGVADMANALESNTINRVNGELAYHVLDIMNAFHDSANSGSHISLESTCRKPEPMTGTLL